MLLPKQLQLAQLVSEPPEGDEWVHEQKFDGYRTTRLERAKCPFTPEPSRVATGASRHWLTPELVAEVAFAEWTSDGRLRHPSFQGVREDKRARDVVREAPVVHKSRRT